MAGLKEFQKWCASERRSIEKAIEFWKHDGNYNMVSYEHARLDELQRVERYIKENNHDVRTD